MTVVKHAKRAGTHKLFWTAVGMAVSIAGPVAAQQTAQSETQGSELGEIVVTAQKRGEDLQSVPLTVNAITAEALDARGITSTLDLQSATPGLVISQTSSAPTIFIRGLGSGSSTPGEEGANALYVDGVYYASLPAIAFSLNNIDRIEVLKGPQGTLFGRNATGGLIHVITRDPSFTPLVRGSFGLANYDTIESQFYGSNGLIDNVLAADLAIYYRNQSEGWGENLFNGQDVYEGSEFAARTKFRWTPTAQTVVTFAADYFETENSYTAGYAPIQGAVAPGGETYTGDSYDVRLDEQPLTISRALGGSVRVEQDFSWAQLVSTTAYRTGQVNVDIDQDKTSVVSAGTYVRTHTNQFSQELQLQSLPDSPVSWIVGLVYFDGETDLNPFVRYGSAQAANGGQSVVSALMDTRSIAGYAQATVPLGSRTNLTGGVRYTEDQRSLDAHTTTALNPTPTNVVDRTDTWEAPTWRIALDHHFTEDLMGYVSYSRGFKSGIYGLFSHTIPPVNPEYLDAYEVGVRSEWFDHRVRFNASVFYYEYDDIQVSTTQTGGGTRILNAASATVQGADIDIAANPFPGLTLTAGATLLDAEFTSFPNSPATVPNPSTCTPTPTELPGPRTGGNRACSIDASGNSPTRAPDYTFSLGAVYEWDIGDQQFSVSANYYRSAEYFFEPDNRLSQPAYDLWNASFRWAPTDALGIRLWGRNLGDTRYYNNVVSSSVDSATTAPPRTYGVTFEFNF